MDLFQLISAAGIGGITGSLLTTVVQSWLAHKSYLENRNFQEKKEAYVGLLNAYRESCLRSGVEEKNKFAYWAVRCELAAPSEINKLIDEMKTADGDQQEKAFKEIKELMRKDLSIQ